MVGTTAMRSLSTLRRNEQCVPTNSKMAFFISSRLVLPPQASYLANDITVGIAVPVGNDLNKQIFSQVIANQN